MECHRSGCFHVTSLLALRISLLDSMSRACRRTTTVLVRRQRRSCARQLKTTIRQGFGWKRKRQGLGFRFDEKVATSSQQLHPYESFITPHNPTCSVACVKTQIYHLISSQQLSKFTLFHFFILKHANCQSKKKSFVFFPRFLTWFFFQLIHPQHFTWQLTKQQHT